MSPDRRSHQSGAALVIVLLLLLVMTLLGLASLRATLLEERMSGALFDRSLAFQSAEYAMREAESFINVEAVNIVSDADARTLFGNAFDCTATGMRCETQPGMLLPAASPVSNQSCAFDPAFWRSVPVIGAPVDAVGVPQFCLEFTGTSIMDSEQLSAEIQDGGATEMTLYHYRIHARSADPNDAAVRTAGRAVVTLQGQFVISRI